jgi:hypothetical protein
MGLSAGRADDFFTAHSVMKDVWNAICAKNGASSVHPLSGVELRVRRPQRKLLRNEE